MKISELAIKRPVSTTMIVLLVVLLGFIAFSRVNIDLYPDMTYPGAAIITTYEGVGPEEMENMITKPLEGAISTVTNIKSISSTSSTGQSIIVAEFNWGTDMDNVVLDMREKVDLIEGFLPAEAEKPIIVKFDPSMLPILQIGVYGEQDLVTLKNLVEDKILPRLERLEGVASVDLVGGKEKEILISLDQSKLNNYGLSFSGVVSTLMAENLNLSGGKVARGSNELLVRITGKFQDYNEIRDILMATPTGTVALKDIAEVKSNYKDSQTISRMNGEPSITLSIQKQTDANTVQVSRLVKEELARITQENQGLEVVPVFDQADFIEKSISNVGRNAIFGALLAVIILFVFLRNIRSTIIIATAIPVSVITTFLLIYFGKLTLNMMTLGGLALGVGMLVDNSIVVLENIYRYRAEGKSSLEAARLGSQEVGMAILASTITTIIVFLPIVFVGGIASQLFKELALTVTFSLLASLLVSLTLIPVMSSKMLKVKQENQGWLLAKLKAIYQSSLNWSLNHRWAVVLLALVFFLGSIALLPLIGMEFIPQMDQGAFTITAQLPLGSSLEESSRIAGLIEAKVLELPEANYVLSNIGSSGDLMGSSNPETVSVYVQLKDLTTRTRTTAEIMEELRQSLLVPGADISIEVADTMGAGMLGGKPIFITVQGEDLDTLEELTLQIKEVMSGVPGVREIEDSISEGRPEFQIKINRSLAARFGLRVSQVASEVKTAIQGTIATRYEIDGEEIDIRVKLAENAVETPEQLKSLLIPSPIGARVPLERIADFQVERGPQKILRENQVRYVSISADLYQADLNKTMQEIQQRIEEEIKLPSGYEIEYGGQFKEMQESFADLFFAFLLAVVLVYMVMASQFESLLHPLVIMFTVPLAIIGVVLGLVISGYNLSVVAIIGVIMLAGIVVNNAIVLVDYINTLRRRGYSLREAILEAGPVRLRPILMTALTTILGLLPLALGIGEGSEVQAPMAVVVIGGLSVATLLTLYVVPVVYSLFAGMSRRVKRKINKDLVSS